MSNEPRIGAGHADAMWRQGLAELRGALYNDSNVAQAPQNGLYGTRTPGEVDAIRKADAVRDSEQEPTSALDARIAQSEKSVEAEDPKTHEPERG